MFGSLAEADDAVQEAWLRLNRSYASGVDNLGASVPYLIGPPMRRLFVYGFLADGLGRGAICRGCSWLRASRVSFG